MNKPKRLPSFKSKDELLILKELPSIAKKPGQGTRRAKTRKYFWISNKFVWIMNIFSYIFSHFGV